MYINDTLFEVDLLDVIEELQSQLSANHIQLLGTIKDTPDNVMVSCPYHKGGQERRPSAGLLKTDGTFHCFACGETRSLQEVISFCFGYHDDLIGGHGWNWLLKNFLTVAVEDRKEIELDYSRNRVETEFDYVSEDELDGYRYYHPYMYKRKLTHDVIDMFDIGFDSKTNCITFPIHDLDGKVLFVARRSVVTKFFNYPSGVSKPVYGLYQCNKYYPNGFLRPHDAPYPTEVIICESMLDAMTCWVYGKYAVALNGLGNDLQFRQLNLMPCRKFILATDMDEAGRKARQRIKKHISNKLVTEFVWDLSMAKDVNDMTKEQFDRLEEIF